MTQMAPEAFQRKRSWWMRTATLLLELFVPELAQYLKIHYWEPASYLERYGGQTPASSLIYRAFSCEQDVLT